MFEPKAVPQDPEGLSSYLSDTLREISIGLQKGLMREVEFLHVAPAKPREGMVRGADGTDWNPGAGKGVYVYYSSAWNKLG